MTKKIIYGCEERGDFDKPYLTRYTFLSFNLFKLYLHIFHRSDADDLHDHPWPFISIILWRGYYEETLNSSLQRVKKRKYPGMVLIRKATHTHRVELISNKKAVTLVITGKYCRNWGFTTNKGWQLWTNYFKEKGC